MKVVVSVLYPLLGDRTFDMDYYQRSHLPLVRELLEPMGLKEMRILEGTSDGAGGSAAFHVIAELLFDDEDSMSAALAAHGPRTQSDIPNFTDTTPIIQISRMLV